MLQYECAKSYYPNRYLSTSMSLQWLIGKRMYIIDNHIFCY